MDTQAPETMKEISYNDSSFSELEQHLTEAANKKAHHLCLFLGLYKPHKEKAHKKLSNSLEREATVINMQDMVSKIESDTFEIMDKLFDSLDQSEDFLYFENGDKLCGSYTSFTASRVKYATPQERYFLEKVEDFQGLVILDVDDFNYADKTLRRAADSIVTFTLPDSKWKRFIWHLKNYSAHGAVVRTKRPDAYSDAQEIS